MLLAPSGGGAPAVPGLDKLVHVAVFALLAGTARWRFGPRGPLLLPLAGYAVATELVQGGLLPDRSGDPYDVVADLVGVAVGWLLAGRLTGTGPAVTR